MYKLSDSRVLETKNNGSGTIVVIRDITNGKSVEIPAGRWTSFILHTTEIDEAVKQLREKKNVHYKEHFGGGYYVSVTTDVWCVDIRRFYSSADSEIKPTKDGIGLRLREWTELQENVIPQLMIAVPDLLAALPCFCGDDHYGPSANLQCLECTPFGKNA